MRATPRVPDDRPNLPSQHPLREASVLTVGATALALLLAAASALFVDLVVWLLPPGFEARLPLELDLPQASSPHSERRQRALQALADEMAEAWQERPYPIELRVVGELPPNAFALPGGRIVVTEALLDNATSLNELGFVLGHEIGHLMHRDPLRRLGRRGLLSLVLASLGVAGAGELLVTVGQLGQLSYDRKQELAADRAGLDLLAARFEHVEGAEQFFEHLEVATGSGVAVPGFVATHPVNASRVEAIARYARDAGYAVEGRLLPPP